MKPLVVLLFSGYPQLSQTYKENEARTLLPHCELKIVSIGKYDTTYKECLPHERSNNKIELFKIIQKVAKFGPKVIHSHYLHMTFIAHRASMICGCKYSIRTHSFDVIGKSTDYISQFKNAINSDRCCGIICFPFLKEKFIEAGIMSHKIFTSYPVVDVKRFLNRSENQEGVMNVGAAIPKKNMKEFFDIANDNPGIRFSLYGIGYDIKKLEKENESLHNKVIIKDCLEPWQMASEYKKNNWLLYTACHHLKNVGWPMAIAEAQASGLGILMRNIRPDLKEYIGSAGFLYDTPEEAGKLLQRKYPEEMREAGFKQAQKSCLDKHLILLKTVWST